MVDADRQKASIRHYLRLSAFTKGFPMALTIADKVNVTTNVAKMNHPESMLFGH